MVVNPVAREVYGYTVELRRLGGLGRLTSAQLVRVRRLMGLLREAGFGGGEISRLSGGRWVASYVRRYAEWSGVVDVSRKSAVFEVFAGFVDGGGRVDDVPAYLEAKVVLDGAGLSFKNAAMVGEAVRVSGMGPREMVAFSAELVRGGRSVEALRARMDLDDRLNGMGLTRAVQEEIMELASGYPSFKDFFNIFRGFNLVDEAIDMKRDVMKEVDALKGEVTRLEERKVELKDSMVKNERIIAELNSLTLMGWHFAWFAMLYHITKEYGFEAVIGTVNADSESRKKLKDSGAQAVGLDVKAAKLPMDTGVKEIIPVRAWGRREYEAAIVGALKGLNNAVQEAPDLPAEVKAIVAQRVKELLKELASRGVSGNDAIKTG